ncbi:MAG TPA: tetratricopeptide repeat protein [Candidatus Angelobacter sp.]|nr:tetratricopeptide repeat protein [Candidatus Angelobacter sp.]
MDIAGAAKVIHLRGNIEPRRFIRSLLVFITAICCLLAHAQNNQLSTAKQLFEQERWQELTQLLASVPRTSADLNYYYGVGLGHLERWQEAESALQAGAKLAPRDKRFPIELAGVAFKQNHFSQARHNLRHALRLDPKDSYANDFLATIYYLQGNLEAALKYWNRVGKPKIASVRNEPPLRVHPALLDHAFAFAPESVLTLDQFLASQGRVHMLETFPSYRFELDARGDGNFDAVFRAQELNGFGNTKIEALARLFGGIFFQEITPEYYNIHGSAANIRTLLRFDVDKRRAYAWYSAPLEGNPKWRVRFGADLRNENWTVQSSFAGPSTFLGALNLRRESVAAEIKRLVGARWNWSTSVEVSHRDFRNINPGTALTAQLLARGYQVKETSALNFELWRSPERRVTVTSGVNSQAGRIWSEPGQAFEKLQASLEGRWLPKPVGDDLETIVRLRGGKTFGELPFDELFMLAVQEDNDLWMHGHEGTRHGQKGSAPLGRDYSLANWETDKNVFSNGYLTVRLGPLLDVGKSWDTAEALGSHKWLFDTGGQAKMRVLGVSVVLSYGKDLRSGNNAFFATVKP